MPVVCIATVLGSDEYVVGATDGQPDGVGRIVSSVACRIGSVAHARTACVEYLHLVEAEGGAVGIAVPPQCSRAQGSGRDGSEQVQGQPRTDTDNLNIHWLSRGVVVRVMLIHNVLRYRFQIDGIARIVVITV